MRRKLRPLFVRPLRDERGVALPLALLGLLSMSLLIMTAMVTSSTELAISSAHQGATRALYVAEGGLQAYVAGRGPNLIDDAGTTFEYQPPSGEVGETVEVSVHFMGEQPRADRSTLRLFSVEAVPVRGGGRRVAILVRQVIPPPTPLETNIQSAITLGGDLDVNGNAFTVTGRSTGCGSQGVQAVRHAIDSDISVNNDKHWDNFVGTDASGVSTTGQAAVQNSGLAKKALIAEALGLAEGQTLDDLIRRIPGSHKWGPRFTPPGKPERIFDGRVDPSEKVAVVDADGGTVDLRGGSGLLIIVNGDLEMSGNASFEGIIIVEGNFTLSGTPRVRGALISMDDDDRNQINLDASAIANGHITVEYDRCEVTDAEEAFAEVAETGSVPFVAATSGWIETSR